MITLQKLDGSELFATRLKDHKNFPGYFAGVRVAVPTSFASPLAPVAGSLLTSTESRDLLEASRIELGDFAVGVFSADHKINPFGIVRMRRAVRLIQAKQCG